MMWHILFAPKEWFMLVYNIYKNGDSLIMDELIKHQALLGPFRSYL